MLWILLLALRGIGVEIFTLRPYLSCKLIIIIGAYGGMQIMTVQILYFCANEFLMQCVMVGSWLHFSFAYAVASGMRI